MRARSGGFSLIELVVVLVLVAILAGGMTAFLVEPFRAWRDVTRRARLVDEAESALRRMARLHLNVEIGRVRVERLEVASRRITQRVNLFEKVLIPRAKENIKVIQIGLGEQERSAVVRSKIAKKKRAAV